jgi:hypothetical protein
MATLKQIDANRQNALRSTGPRTPEGKAASRFNALKSGIDAQAQVIPGEDPAQLEALIAEYQERFDASLPERRMLVDTLVVCEWLFRRLSRAEASFWQYEAHLTESSFMSNKHPEGRVLFFGDKVFDRLQRRVNAIHRNYDRALKELKSLEATATEDAQVGQALPPANPEDAQAAPVQSNQQPAPHIGFVPPTHGITPQPGPVELAASPCRGPEVLWHSQQLRKGSTI